MYFHKSLITHSFYRPIQYTIWIYQPDKGSVILQQDCFTFSLSIHELHLHVIGTKVPEEVNDTISRHIISGFLKSRFYKSTQETCRGWKRRGWRIWGHCEWRSDLRVIRWIAKWGCGVEAWNRAIDNGWMINGFVFFTIYTISVRLWCCSSVRIRYPEW